MNKCLILDSETATLPKLKDLERQGIVKDISLRHPIIYDMGWVIVDLDTGNIISKYSAIVMETFFNESVFATAYYREKRQAYEVMIDNGETEVKRWKVIAEDFLTALKEVNYVSAYNAQFDYKAIERTEKYIQRRVTGTLNGYEKWLIDFYSGNIKTEKKKPKAKGTKIETLNFRDVQRPIADIWGMACDYLADTPIGKVYKQYCLDNELTKDRVYFPSNAETVYKFLMDCPNFKEQHTALADSEIETDILLKVLSGMAIKTGITYFPFRKLGKVADFEVCSC